jgi:hypothetical protein
MQLSSIAKHTHCNEHWSTGLIVVNETVYAAMTAQPIKLMTRYCTARF